MKIGTKVSVLDDNLIGHVKELYGDNVIIKTTDGFLLSFLKNELIAIPENDIVSNSKTLARKSVDMPLKKAKNDKPKKKKKAQPPMEVDLHIEQLVNSKKNLTNHDMLTLQVETAKRKLEFAISKKIQRVVFIHGVGEGVLKLELEYLFGRYNNIKFYAANYQKYGLGATEVYIYQSSN